MEMRLNDGWRFAKGEPVNFTPVELPHDWLISDTTNLYASGVGWYQRDLMPASLRKANGCPAF